MAVPPPPPPQGPVVPGTVLQVEAGLAVPGVWLLRPALEGFEKSSQVSAHQSLG